MPVFDLDAVTASSKAVFDLPIPAPAGESSSLTVLVTKGREAGPVLLVLAGVHGDEYEGVVAIQQVFRQLSPEDVKGTLVAIPVSNPLAYAARTRSTPEDGKNLARVFPGDPAGSVTERIAFALGTVIGRADLLLDLHSAGTTLTGPTLVGYYAHPGPVGATAEAAAQAFGAPVVWRHPSLERGRTLSLAAELGIPALYTEANGGMRVRADELGIFSEGVLNVMGYLGMLERPPAPPPRYRLGGSGNTDAMLSFSRSGLFLPAVEVLQAVRRGDLVGRVRDLDGTVAEEIEAPGDGRVVFLRAVPPVVPGDLAVLIADELTEVG